jgi:formylglycine-generating enzyme required for sulfatase activity
MNAGWKTTLSQVEAAARASDCRALAGRLTELTSAVASCGESDIEDLCAVAAMHHLPWVRQTLLRVLARRWPAHTDVREAVAWLTHDYEDFVAFEAITLAGSLRISDVLADLFVIVGRASERTRRLAGKPVGLGHAVVLRAIEAIAGDDPQHRDLATIERDLFSEGLDTAAYPPLPPRHSAQRGTHAHADMATVTGGRVLGGPPPAFDPDATVFDWNDPPVVGGCGDLHIDVLPVSNVEYDRFSHSPDAASHRFCHPAEPRGKLHLRNTILDRRSGPDHPVTGVDWFDAYAYAASLGKRLPTEAEWQRAGEGDDRRAYPWGDGFDPARSHCRQPVGPTGWNAVLAWRRELLDLADHPPRATTRPRDIPGSESPFGVRDLSGNVWEWTASAFDGAPLSPAELNRDAIDVIYDQRSYAVIKGGAWSCLPEQASVAFRGRDLALDRHFEIGFRCACDCPA